jgi:type I restriction enzyme S subunit
MDNASTKIKLGKVLTRRKDEIDVQELESYKRLTIRMNGQGIEVRDCVLGSQIGTKRQFIVESGQLVLSKIDARNGAFGILPDACDKAIITGNFWAFDIDHAVLESRYFDYLTKTPLFVDFCIRASDGTTNRLYLQESKFLNMEISLPPIAEQRRIVARIEELAAKIEEARGLRESAIDQLEALYAATLSLIFGETSVDGHLVDVLLDKPRNGWSARCDNMPHGIPVLSLGAVTGFNYRAHEFKRTSEPVSENAHYWLRSGDLLITRSNTPELVGHAAIYNGSPEPCIYPDLMMKLKIDEKKARKKFVHHWLASRTVRDFIQSNAKGTSPTMKKIAQGTVMNIPFPSNLSLQEQEELVIYFDDLKAQINQMKVFRENALKEFDALLPAILDKAFKGEL